MRHRKAYSKLNRDKDHRKALKRNQLRALFKYEKIVTTVAKAKLLRKHADKIVTLAKKGDLASKRLVLREIPDKELVHKIFSEIAPKMAGREGGYTRVLRYKDRKGDGAPMAVVELVLEELKVKVKRKKIKEEQKKKEENALQSKEKSDVVNNESEDSVQPTTGETVAAEENKETTKQETETESEKTGSDKVE
jgi:large subunit ribosomal protein L17